MTLLQRASTILTTLLLATMLAAAPAAPAEPDLEDQFFSLINAERAASGLDALQGYWDLKDDARAHSRVMMDADYLHHNPNLADVTTGWYALGENVGVGPTVASLHAAFMASAGHAANVRGDYNYIGIGVERESPTRMWVTVVFMRGPAGLGDAPTPKEQAPTPAPAPAPAPATLPAGASNVGLVDTAAGMWYLRSTSGNAHSFYYGDPGDYPMLGDWDCDGVDTPGLYRQSDGYVYLRNSNTQGVADVRFYFGNPGDVPLAGDFNGNGCDTVSLYRPSQSRVFIINRLGFGDRGLGAADFSFALGGAGTALVAGDFDGDGVDTVAVAPDGDCFAGDWDGDGAHTLGRFNPAAGEFVLTDGAGTTTHTFFFGNPGWRPIAGDARLG